MSIKSQLKRLEKSFGIGINKKSLIVVGWNPNTKTFSKDLLNVDPDENTEIIIVTKGQVEIPGSYINEALV